MTGQPTYVNPANGRPVRDQVTVRTDRPEGYGSGQTRQRDLVTNQPLRDANGDYVPGADPAPRPNARVVWEFVPSAGEWRPVTHFPVP